MSVKSTFLYKPGASPLSYVKSHSRKKGGGKRPTERSVEVPIAEYWLNKLKSVTDQSVIEVGAVTSHFWKTPARKGLRLVTTIDPRPKQPHATNESLFSVDFTNKIVLSISTIEHVDDGRYGLPLEGKTPLDAYRKISTEAARFLITIPYGWEQGKHEVGPLQQFLLNDPVGVSVFTLTRLNHSSSEWSHSSALETYSGGSANSLILIEKGGLL